MIPARDSYYAEYQVQGADGRKYPVQKQVEAWDDEGRPMVVGKNRLVPADSLSGFRGLSPNNEEIRAVIPGGGWRVRVKNTEQTWEEMVVAWVIDRQGWATPLTPEWNDPEELAPIAGSVDGDAILLPPEAPPPASTR